MVKYFGFILTICFIEFISVVESISRDSTCGFFKHRDVSAIVKNDGDYFDHSENSDLSI